MRRLAARVTWMTKSLFDGGVGMEYEWEKKVKKTFDQNRLS